MTSMNNEKTSTDSVNGDVKSSKSSSKPYKKAMDPKLLTPEYIAEQRRLRELRKAKERKQKEALGLLPPPEKDDKFVKRPMLDVAKPQPELPTIKIMSYNVLAQTLIRREIYPTNGKILKWSVRSQILLDELKHYNADILCLQEVDKVQYTSFWSSQFEKLGYGSKFYRYNTKNHGCVIVFRQSLFDCKNQSFIKLDQDLNQTDDEKKLPDARIATNNIGFMVYLEFQPKFVKQYPVLENANGIIIGTTHLFWHPFGTYERTRQMYILMYKFKEFQHVLNIILGNHKKFYSFFTGDFNSEPFDSPYRAITTKPIKFAGRSKNVLGCSLSYTFSKDRSLDDGDDEENESELERERDNNPDDPEPDSFDPTPEQDRIMTELEEAHNDLDIRAISLYSVGYKQVHEENANNVGHRNEPAFSNWVDKWNGMLDYIFVLVPWNKTQDYSERIDTPDELAQQYNIKLLKLLRLPTPKEMGPPPSGQPRMHQYPSDHLCIMAEIQLL
ncbi:hypothetical protein CTRG_02779 [Candida tropicalis MYA-3404]|uniref:Endonuclease/exonuclease/phosphatase domain-containing protein n=1 Tax=Candida tropicalis (strain ATCC MYA-3404 / T1) TaxID=294747 RepID=C5M8Q7_CANTT|nr:hypothetical protein CTRG_02779 [Candida tropicalis MYA-3404]EER33961.1 hypothetical protein CTRG_02779 [Candida tropicalis MYA-3404]KAG4407816.1 hypothetical protein JTP64_003351 [Candida tropicalis]